LRVIAVKGLPIRDVRDRSVERFDAEAASLGLSSKEFLRRKLEAETATEQQKMTSADWARSATVFEDLADPDLMDRAWR